MGIKRKVPPSALPAAVADEIVLFLAATARARTAGSGDIKSPKPGPRCRRTFGGSSTAAGAALNATSSGASVRCGSTAASDSSASSAGASSRTVGVSDASSSSASGAAAAS